MRLDFEELKVMLKELHKASKQIIRQGEVFKNTVLNDQKSKHEACVLDNWYKVYVTFRL